ncbi:MAG TPA: hypothetical protein VJA44_07015 [Acidimicrobiia bacterium]|nr:hypothetical protein [Acidimicrobiia bacterium]HLE39385.1 hypothetical protein [Acidimicrobiia bacterium]
MSDNVKTLARWLLGAGVPAWFIGLILTAVGAGPTDSPSAFEEAFSTFMLVAGLITVGAGLAALVVGAAIADLREGKSRTAASRTRKS